jgi:hypothetical protein
VLRGVHDTVVQLGGGTSKNTKLSNLHRTRQILLARPVTKLVPKAVLLERSFPAEDFSGRILDLGCDSTDSCRVFKNVTTN